MNKNETFDAMLLRELENLEAMWREVFAKIEAKEKQELKEAA